MNKLRIIISNSILYDIAKWFCTQGLGGGIFNNYGTYVRLKKDIIGHNNFITISRGAVLRKTRIRIRGNNNTLFFGENCSIGKNCSFWMEGNNISIVVGGKCTFTRDCEINAQEDDVSIIIGEDCMFSNTIVVRTSDSHPIYDLASKKRVNPARNVVIGNHVWIAPNTKIMKGANIADGVIIGSDSMVNGEIPENVLAVGRPARVVKSGVYWTRENIMCFDKEG